ncbi:acetyl-CoA carboxylase biotin carboxyl carrier protein [Orrella sp. 11846]|uniref:acetyl-CoA carboxylase biotin carboxyl carrier protein n=1 Tax=Orrella sp. 11846 TaxID=3409913 RepID=UPI003B5A3A6D
MDLRKLKTLIDLVAESDIAELEITEGEDMVRIVKSVAPTAVVSAAPAPVTVSVPAVAAAAAVSGADESPNAGGAIPDENLIKAPMVGTFYRAPSPGAKPFVEVGDSVREGQALCIVEAMKLLNEIEADRAGVIKEILIDNGEPVEFGQPLFVID